MAAVFPIKRFGACTHTYLKSIVTLVKDRRQRQNPLQLSSLVQILRSCPVFGVQASISYHFPNFEEFSSLHPSLQ